ncbi:MAG TPA: hypothetical protein VK563_14575 [Puia sp.]|nr:hypothetical protein [Puia sp.]
MKKTTPFLAILCLLMIFYSCKKDGTLTYPNLSISNQVNAWLESQKSTTIQIKNENIKALNEHLDFNKVGIEHLNEKEKLIVVPIKDGYSIKNNNQLFSTTQNPIYSLVLVLNESGKIRKGNIVQYIPESQTTTKIPDNTFHNIFNQKKLEVSGRFRFLNLQETLFFEFNYGKGSMTSASLRQPKSKTTEVTNGPVDQYGADCIAWYWVEYDTDSGDEIGSTYLYTTCDGGGGGGGSSGGDDSEPEIGQNRLAPWVVASNPDLLWTVTSTETLSGVLNSSQPLGGHFTNIIHQGSALVASPGYSWLEYNATSYSDYTASSSISGVITRSDGNQYYLPTITHYFIFNDYFQ